MRRQETPLNKYDLATFARESSDFAFEMEVLRALRAAGLDCEHAATYTDPITSRLRAYDIRARHILPSQTVRLAVECKNLKSYSPLLVHATPRRPSEAYHTVVARVRGSLQSYRREPPEAVYHAHEPVGRHTDQPFKDDKGNLSSSDSATFEKWLQAVNGCNDLLIEIIRAPHSERGVHAIVPLLVIPEGTLWQVDYDDNGQVTEPPREVDKTTLILRHAWTAHTGSAPLSYDISHLEIATLPSLQHRVSSLILNGGLLAGAEALL
jgi:hypothetical protein